MYKTAEHAERTLTFEEYLLWSELRSGRSSRSAPRIQ